MDVRTERRITYTYGPEGVNPPYQGSVWGFLGWEELEAQIRDERWGSPFTITERQERTLTIGDWIDVRERLGRFE